MSASKVYFTDMRCPVGTGLLDKLKKLIEKAGCATPDSIGYEGNRDITGLMGIFRRQLA